MSAVAAAQDGSMYLADAVHHSILRVSATGEISVVAGTGVAGFFGDGGRANRATLNAPAGLALDPAGNLYFTDSGNGRVRRIDRDGRITTVVAGLGLPYGLAVDSSGNIYVADAGHHRIYLIGQQGKLQALAGTGAAGFSGDGGPALQARISSPLGIAVTSNEEVYFSDAGNGRVRRIASDGTIHTVAQDLDVPVGLAADNAGNIFIAESGKNRILRLAPDGSLQIEISAGLLLPRGLTLDASGTLYVADLGGARRADSGGQGPTYSAAIRSRTAAATLVGLSPASVAPGSASFTLTVNGSGFGADSVVLWNGNSRPTTFVSATQVTASIGAADVTTTGAGLVSVFTGGTTVGPMPLFIVPAYTNSWIAGGGYDAGSGGLAVNALLYRPAGLAFDGAGNLFFADRQAHLIRKVSPSGIITTVAGTGVYGFSGDGGPATAAKFASPQQVALDSLGNLYVTDQENGRVRKITPGGTISTFAGAGSQTGEGIPATTLYLYQPDGLLIDASDNVYVGAHFPFVVRKITPAGIATTFAGGGSQIIDGVAATSFSLNGTGGFALDAVGNFYVADSSSIRKINSSGIITRYAGTGSTNYGFTGDGGLATDAILSYPTGMVFDNFGNLYLTDSNNGRVRFVSSNGYITTIAGGGSDNTVGGGGPALQAALSTPLDVIKDASGSFYVSSGAIVSKLYVPNPAAPDIGLLSPANPVAGNAGFTLFVTGTGFSASSIVQWNGSNRPTTFISAFQLSAQISASDVLFGGNVAVTIFTPTIGASVPRYYTVRNPIPTVTSVSPNRVLTGSGATLTVTGTNFNQTSVVLFNYGTALPTTFVSTTQLTATLSPSQTTQVSSTGISVRNPSPGGGTSANAGFSVQASSAVLQVASDSGGGQNLRSESLGDALSPIRFRNNSSVHQIIPAGTIIRMAFDAPIVGSPTIVGSGSATANIFTEGTGSNPASPATVSATASLNLLTVNILQDLTIVNTGALTIQGLRINPSAVTSDNTFIYVQVSTEPLGALGLNGNFYFLPANPVSLGVGILSYALAGPTLRPLGTPPVTLGTTTTAFSGGSPGPAVLYQNLIPTTPVLSSGTISSLPPGIGGVAISVGALLTSMATENGLTPLAPVAQGTRVTLSLSGLPSGITLFVPQIFGTSPILTLVNPATGSILANALGTQLQAFAPDASGNLTVTYETTTSSNPVSNSLVTLPVLLTLNTGASLPLGSFGSATMSVGPTTGTGLLRFVSNSTVFTGALFNVIAAPPGVTIASLTPSNPSMTPGSTISMAVVLNRRNFTGTVTLGLIGSLPGIASSIIQPGTGNTATIVFQALQNAPAVTSFLSVTVSGAGFNTVSTPFTLTVTSAQGSVSPSYVPALPGTAFSIPIRLNLNTNISANSLTFGVRLLPSGGAPALGGSLSFTRDAAISEVPTTDTGGLADSLTVAWPSLATALTGNRILGTINGMVPAGAALGQSYAVQVTGASAALDTTPVSLSYGLFGSVGVTNVIFRVGDVYPFTGDAAPNFGDGTLNVLDLIQELFAVNNVPGYAPAACSDRADAMDLYPPDGATRGGDGVLNVLDLTRELFRVNNLDMDRPQRATLSGVCAHALENSAWRRNWDNPDGAIVFGPALGEGSTERIPVFLDVSRTWSHVAFTFAAGDGRRQLNFVSATGHVAPLVHSGAAGVVAAAWLDGLSVSAGQRLLLGYIEGPAGVAADLELYGMSANSLDDGRPMRLNHPRTAVR